MTSEDRGHREIDHTADLGFEVWAASKGELFAEAVAGLAELCYERSAVRPLEHRSVEVAAESDEELLVHWLQEAYLQLESAGWLVARAGNVAVEPGRVVGELLGEAYDEQRHTLHTEIKAVTYHGLSVQRDADGTWRATVIVDV